MTRARWILILVVATAGCRAACAGDGPGSPATPAGTPNAWLEAADVAVPDTVFIEEMTWPEVHAAVAAGKTTILLPTGGVEQNGPHVVLGKHNIVMRHTADRIARELGDALVAPIVSYVPEGDPETRTGHMAFTGTVGVPEAVFEQVLEHAARALVSHGFKTICLIGDSGGNVDAQDRVAERLTRRWGTSGIRVIHVTDYYSGANGQVAWLEAEGESAAAIGTHAGIRDTSEVMALDPGAVRADRLADNGGGDSEDTGVWGDPTRASAERGRKMLDLKVGAAVRQIRARR